MAELRVHRPSDLTLELTILPGNQPSDGGRIHLRFADGDPVKVDLLRMHFRFLHLLAKAAVDDASAPGLPDCYHGIRSTTAIMTLYAAQVGDHAQLSSASVFTYLSTIRRAIRCALEKIARSTGAEFPADFDPIEYVTGSGFRFGNIQVRVYDFNDRDKSAAR